MDVKKIIRIPKKINSLSVISVLLLLLAQVGLSADVNSQVVVVKIDTSKITQHSLSDKSADKVLLFPSMTTEQRDAIISPAEGMVIYNATARKPQFYNGTGWIYFDATHHFLGEEFGGGIIFFIDASGDHGLVAAPADQHTSAKWGFFETPAGANSKAIGAGLLNTDKISSISPSPDIAARLCSDLLLNGYHDWFLPSLDELVLMYKNLKLKGIGNFAPEDYWTSSETDFNNAWMLNFNTGIPIESNVNKPNHVRAVRQF